MRVSFYLREYTTGNGVIWFHYTHNGKERISTGIRIPQKAWSAKTARVKKSFVNSAALNRRLASIEEEIMSCAYSLIANGIAPTPDRVKLEYLGNPENKRLGFWDGYKDYLENVVEVEQSQHGIKNHQQSHTFLKRFEKDQGRPITFESLGKTWDKKYRQWLHEEYGNVKDTQTKKLVMLKSYLEYARRSGWHSNEAYTFWNSAYTPGSADVVLTLDELVKVAQAEATGPMERIRDMVLAYSLTGLRYEAGQEMTMNSYRNGCYYFHNQKGRKDQVLPMCRVVDSIIQKYQRFPQYSNQPFNRMVKEFCREVGIDADTIRRGDVQPKYKRISSKVFRKTFNSLLLNNGVDKSIRQHLLGHTSTEAIAHYEHFEEGYLRKVLEETFQPITNVYSF